MIYTKKETADGNFAEKGKDICDGDTVTIKDEGKEVEGKYGSQNVFTIATKNGEFLMSFNQTSINALIDQWGIDSLKWVGQQVQVHAIKQNVAGKFLDVYYVAPIGFTMGDGGFVPSGPVNPASVPEDPNSTNAPTDIDQANEALDQAVDENVF